MIHKNKLPILEYDPASQEVIHPDHSDEEVKLIIL